MEGCRYQTRTPYLIIIDQAIIYDLLIKDFSYFSDRGFYSDFKANPLLINLLNYGKSSTQNNKKQIDARFHVGKAQGNVRSDQRMRRRIGKKYRYRFKRKQQRNTGGGHHGRVFNRRRRYLRFRAQVLKAINDDEFPFRKYGKSIFTPSLRAHFRELCLLVTPALLKVKIVKDFPTDVTDIFHSVFKETITYKLENTLARNDFVQCLIQARCD